MALAAYLNKPNSWVSNYVDDPPTRNADLDTALAICAMFGVNLAAFQDGEPSPAPTVPALTKTERRALRLLALTSDAGQRRALGLLAEIARAFPRPRPQQSAVQIERTREATARKGHGKR